jgi:hypothetical protein
LEEDERELDERYNKEETTKIKNKVETVTKMLQLYKKLREERETVCLSVSLSLLADIDQ